MVDTLELIQIDTADTIEELREKEIRHIKQYNSYFLDGKGYNMTYGGDGSNGYVFSEEVKEKMKKRCENPEVRKHMSEISKKYFKDNPEKITKHGEIFKKYYEDNPEARKEHSKRMKKHYEDNPEARKKHFENNPEAGKEHGERLKKYYEDNPEAGKKNGERLKKSYQKPGFKQKILDLKGKNKPFDVFTTDSKFVKTFTYQFEAAEYLRKEHNITTAIAVSGVLLGKQNSSAGFVFKYK
jgi:hypothetical protein